jgi:hypothetical protein
MMTMRARLKRAQLATADSDDDAEWRRMGLVRNVERTLQPSAILLQLGFIFYNLEYHSAKVVIGSEPIEKRPFHRVEIGRIHTPSMRIGNSGYLDTGIFRRAEESWIVVYPS